MYICLFKCETPSDPSRTQKIIQVLLLSELRHRLRLPAPMQPKGATVTRCEIVQYELSGLRHTVRETNYHGSPVPFRGVADQVSAVPLSPPHIYLIQHPTSTFI